MEKNAKISLLLIIFISLCLLFVAAGKMSFWEDETFTSTQSQKSYPDLLESVKSDVHPVLPLIITSLWGKFFGYDEIGLRSLSVIFSGFSLLLTYFLAKELFDQNTALISVSILAFSPLFIMFGHQARYYPLAMLVSLLLILCLRNYLENYHPIFLFFYVLTGSLLVYISYSAASVVIAANLWWGFDWVRKKPGELRHMIYWVVAQGLILLAYLPSIPHIGSVVESYYGLPDIDNLILEAIKRTAYLVYTYSVGQTISPLNPIAWIGCLLVGFLIGLAIFTRRRQKSLWFLGTILVVVISINLVISFMSGWLSQIWQNLPHWTFYSLPFWAILLASGLTKLKSKWSWILMVMLYFVYGSAHINYFTGRQYIQPVYAVPWKEIFQNIQENASSDMALVCYGSDVACKYYARRFDFEHNLFTDEKHIPYDQVDQVWWIQIYLGQERPGSERIGLIQEQLSEKYSNQETYPYARQDDSLRMLKVKYLGKEDYEYRVVVYRYYGK